MSKCCTVVVSEECDTVIVTEPGTQGPPGSGGGGGGSGTVTQVDGGAGLTGSVTTSGALAVGAGTGITVNANDVAINRTVVDTWYEPAGAIAGLQPLDADLTALAAAGNSAVLATTTASFMTSDETKLDGIAAGATVNSSDASLRDRATHTGTQVASTISDFATAADARIAAASVNALSDVTVSAPSVGQVLKWNGSAWVNDTDATGGGGGATNLSVSNITSTTLDVLSDTGTDATIPAATASAAGLATAAQIAKLNGIATGATALSIGTTAGTAAEGNDSRITGAAQKSANLSDLASASTARTNLGLGTLATQSGTFSGTHSGDSSGTNTGDQTNVTGNAGTATALQTARNINGVAFDGTANITVPASAGTLTGATIAAGVTDSSLTSVGTLATLTVTAPIVGSVTGNASTVTTNANLTGDVTSTGNATTIASAAVTYGKIQNVATARLLGRATAGAGVAEEITLGTNLSFTGTTLNASGGGGSPPTGTGVVTVTGSVQDAAARPIGVTNATDILSRADGDARFAPTRTTRKINMLFLTL